MNYIYKGGIIYNYKGFVYFVSYCVMLEVIVIGVAFWVVGVNILVN